MKKNNSPTKDERLDYQFKRSIFLGLGISLLENRAIIWAILNGDSSKWHILVIVTILLIIGCVLGEYMYGRWFREKFMSAVNEYN